jgi:DNA-binding transcriptional LysR family regulator
VEAVDRHPWTGVEFRHLAALAAIAEAGSFRAAAQRLGYVQSAVSQQVAFLERTLDVRLIERAPGTGPVALTDAGELVLGHVEAILARLGAARADIEALGRDEIVRLDAPPALEARFIPALLAAGVRVAMAGDDADAALVSGQGGRRVLEDPIVLLVNAADPRREPLVVRRTLNDTATARPDGPVVYATDDDATAHALVAAGQGAAILPALSVDRDDPRVIAMPYDAPPRVVSVVWNEARALTPALKHVLAAITDVGARLQRELLR